MIRVLPCIAKEKCFALKGGTAINLFLRDMPRLSVDLDLAYLPIEPWEGSKKNISSALNRISDCIERTMPDTKVWPSYVHGEKNIAKLFVRNPEAQIKIEPNQIIRGAVFPSMERTLSRNAEKLFELSVSVATLSLPDLYGGKICAALDRQHPRDLFDIHLLLKNEGITNDIRKAFIVYLASHDRPMNELIDPRRKDFKDIFEKEFLGMSSTAITYEELKAAREKIISVINKELTDSERRFLISVKETNPKWELLGIPGIERLPAIQWKLTNIQKMGKAKRANALSELKSKLGL